MKKKLLYCIFSTLCCIMLCLNVSAQVKTKVYPEGVSGEKIIDAIKKGNEIKISAPQIFEKLLRNKITENSEVKEYKNKFALPVVTDIDIIKSANRWEESDKFFYSITLHAEYALNISIQFSEFLLSENSVLSVFTAYEITDSITVKENNPNNIWATRIYQGERLHILLRVPKKEEGMSRLKISQIGFGFREVGGDFFGKPGASAACNINVICPEGTGWENERNSVALIVANLSELCTGTLVMNTCSTSRPYLLTANHCLNSNIQNWVFQFQTWSNTCTPNGTFREDLQFNGCQLRANNAATDFALVELNQTPLANSGVTYSGWSRNTNPALRTTGIHHPMGDLMKISHDFQPPVTVSWISGPASHWRATFDQGIVQHGSSGSALFDENHRIIGQLHGNQNNICPIGNEFTCWCVTQIPSIGEYGRFDVSWEGGGTPATRLSNWLDPNNTGVMATNTTDVTNLQAASLNLSITGDDNICFGNKQYNLAGSAAGATIIWESSDQNIAQVNGSGTQATVTYVNNGIVIIKATIYSNCFSPNTVSRKITVGTPKPGPVSWTWNAPPNRVMLDVDDVPGATSYQWYLNGVLKATTAASYYHLPMKGNVSCGNFYYFGVRAVSSCGTSPESYVGADMPPCGFAYKVFPNPSPGNIQIKPNEDETATSNNKKTAEIQEVELYDKMGVIRHKQKFAKGQTTVNISVGTLRNDVYILRIFDGETWQSCKIIIQH